MTPAARLKLAPLVDRRALVRCAPGKRRPNFLESDETRSLESSIRPSSFWTMAIRFHKAQASASTFSGCVAPRWNDNVKHLAEIQGRLRQR
jgi:hypothetical protein